jgi:hypothetical protein
MTVGIPLFSLSDVLISTEARELGSRAITEDLLAVMLSRRSWWKYRHRKKPPVKEP